MADTKEAAEYFSVTPRTILRRIHSGVFPADRLPARPRKGKRGRYRGATSYKLDLDACADALRKAGEQHL